MNRSILLLLVVLCVGSSVIGCGKDESQADMDFDQVRAYSALFGKDYSKALMISDQSLVDYPDSGTLLEIKGEASFFLEQYSESIAAFSKALLVKHDADYPVDKPKCYLFRGKSYLAIDDQVKAKSDFEECLKVAEKDSEEYSEAIKEIEKLKEDSGS